jgi:hypothetical protein
MKPIVRVATLTAAALIALAAQAQSTKTLEQIQQSEAATVNGLANHTNRECGSNIAVSFNWSGVKEADLETYSPSGWCEAALDGIRNVCADNPGKEAVREKIKTLTCSFAPERSVSLKDGNVDYKISFRSTNDAIFVFETLENAL